MDGEYSPPAEHSRMDALTELLGSLEFRAATAKWRPAFEATLVAYDTWLTARNDAAQTDEVMACPQASRESSQAKLRDVLTAIQEQARRDIADDWWLRLRVPRLRGTTGDERPELVVAQPTQTAASLDAAAQPGGAPEN